MGLGYLSPGKPAEGMETRLGRGGDFFQHDRVVYFFAYYHAGTRPRSLYHAHNVVFHQRLPGPASRPKLVCESLDFHGPRGHGQRSSRSALSAGNRLRDSLTFSRKSSFLAGVGVEDRNCYFLADRLPVVRGYGDKVLRRSKRPFLHRTIWALRRY